MKILYSYSSKSGNTACFILVSLPTCIKFLNRFPLPNYLSFIQDGKAKRSKKKVLKYSAFFCTEQEGIPQRDSQGVVDLPTTPQIKDAPVTSASDFSHGRKCLCWLTATFWVSVSSASGVFQSISKSTYGCTSVFKRFACLYYYKHDYAYKIYNRSYNYMLFQACNQKENKRELCHISHAGDEKVG